MSRGYNVYPDGTEEIFDDSVVPEYEEGEWAEGWDEHDGEVVGEEVYPEDPEPAKPVNTFSASKPKPQEYKVFLKCKDGNHDVYSGSFKECVEVASRAVKEGVAIVPNTMEGVELYSVLSASVRSHNG